MAKTVKSRFFTDKEVKDFRRLSKVYNYKNIVIERDLFPDSNNVSNVVTMTISFNSISGTDERNLGNIAKICKAKRITLPNKNKMKVVFSKF